MSVSASRAARRRNTMLQNNTNYRNTYRNNYRKYPVPSSNKRNVNRRNKKIISTKDLINNNQLPADFNWRAYVALNDDIGLDEYDEEKAVMHYLLFGSKENRPYKEETSLFSRIKYRTIAENKDDKYVSNPLWCHIHSNHPKDLTENKDFIKLSKYFSMIFTCDYNIASNVLPEHTFLHIDCKHPHIDRKNYVLKYLNENEYVNDLVISVDY